MMHTTLLGVVVLLAGAWGASLPERVKRQADDHPFPMTSWTDWIPCTKSCDGGLQTRNNCSSQPCMTSLADCHLMPCTDPYDWGEFGACDASCDGGRRTRVSGPDCSVPSCSQDQVAQNIACHTQSCAPVDGCGIADLIFVLDSSGSVGDTNWHITKQFVIDVVKGLGDNVGADLTRVSVVSFSTEINKEFDLQTYYSLEEIEVATWATKYSAGATNTADGIRMMSQIFNDFGRPEVKNIGVVLTDGKSNVLPETTSQMASLAHQLGVSMFAIGVGSQVNEDELIDIASEPADTYVFMVTDYDALQSITQQIVDETCETATQMTCSEWSEWETCSVTCGGGGSQSRYKDCEETNANGDVVEESTVQETQDCGDNECPPPTTTPEPTTPEPTTPAPTTPEPTTPKPTTPAPTTPEPTTPAPTTPEPTTTELVPIPASSEDDSSDPEIEIPDCSLCDYGTANVYFSDPTNCLWFYQCARSVKSYSPNVYTYTRSHLKCPAGTFFNEKIWNCDHIANANIRCRRQTTEAATTTMPQTTELYARCPLTPVLLDITKFRLGGQVMSCALGTRFSWLACGCVRAIFVNQPDCVDEDGLLLHYPFNDHFNDVTCKQIPSDVYGQPSLKWDAIEGKSAYFDGKSALVVDYMTNIFNGQNLQTFSVALWFKRIGARTPFAGLVNNGNCDTKPTFSVHAERGAKASGIIETLDSKLQANLPNYAVGHYEWVHVAMVYNGDKLTFFVDGRKQKGSVTVTGGIGNTKCPMQIGHEYKLKGPRTAPEEDTFYFKGYMDELRIYTKALNAKQVGQLYEQKA